MVKIEQRNYSYITIWLTFSDQSFEQQSSLEVYLCAVIRLDILHRLL
jgi:hypothetical protein